MKIKYTVDNVEHEAEVDSLLEIVADDGRDIYILTCAGASLTVHAGGMLIEHEDKIYGNHLSVKPRFSNEVVIEREVYE